MKQGSHYPSQPCFSNKKTKNVLFFTWKVFFHKISNWFRALRRIQYFDLDRVPLTEARLEVLWTPQTTKLAVDHDRQTRAERFALFHAERIQMYKRAFILECSVNYVSRTERQHDGLFRWIK